MKNKDFLICVDSDGCVMDGMTIKHIKCFGPCIIEVWELYNKEEYVLNKWNEINLFSKTRGINRFKGLVLILAWLREQDLIEDEITEFLNWTNNAKELSNASLEKEIIKSDHACLKKVLLWSRRVNEEIGKMPKDSVKPFEGTKEALFKASLQADIAIISSANKEAVYAEWSQYELLQYTNAVMTQEFGSKMECIRQQVELGYKKENVIMIGDALGDKDAAFENGVLFYPIVAGKEIVSWKEFSDCALEAFIKGSYQDKKMADYINTFEKKLKVE